MVVLFSLYEHDVRNSLTKFLFMISVWTGRNSGLDEDKDPLLLELVDEGMLTEDVEDAEDATEDGRDESQSLMLVSDVLCRYVLTPHCSEVV